MTDPVLSVAELQTHLDTESGVVRAVDDLNFDVGAGETVCLVGESGSGKTLVCDTITGLVGPPADISGEVTFEGQNLLSLSGRELRSIRGDKIAYVFQNAQSALDPVYTVGEQIAEAITFHQEVSDEEARQRAIELLRTVSLSRAAERVDEYPHELSDGMCQRVAIAIALASEPDLLIADEPTSALDVMVQARIIELLDELRAERDFSLLLVTHDLRVVAALADRVVVLYGGTDVERGPADAVLESPAHPYTQDLFESFAGQRGAAESARAPIPDEGCRYYRECPHAIDACKTEKPPFEPIHVDESHHAACVYHGPDRDAATVMSSVTRTESDTLNPNVSEPVDMDADNSMASETEGDR